MTRIPLDRRLFMLFAVLLLVGGVAYFVKDWIRTMILLPIIDALGWLYLLGDSLSQFVLWVFFLFLGGLYVFFGMVRIVGKELHARERRRTPMRSDHRLSPLRHIDPSNPYAQQRFARHLVELYFEAVGKKTGYAWQMWEELKQQNQPLPPEVWAVFQFGLQGNRRFQLVGSWWDYWEIRIPYAESLIRLLRIRLRKPRTSPPLSSDSFALEEGLSLENEFPPPAYFEKTLFFIEQQLFMHHTIGVP